MIDEKTWIFVSKMLIDMQIQGDKFRKATEGLLIAPESPLIEPHHVTEGNLIKVLERLIEDDFDKINWFVYECDYGRKPLEAGCENDMRLINSIEKIRWLIELNCNT